ncbi:Long-chain-alcohol oxidase [Nymphaea thermarum]|nr:Long-chain-alcohol oxidase [Nymphaea thermarum]
MTDKEKVGELMVRRLPKEAVLLVWWVLWALSTRLGTVVLCGRAGLCSGFPFVRRFAEMKQEEREKVLVRWSTMRGLLCFFRLAFAIFKVFSLYVFYSQVDESMKNPSWKAIGYDVNQRRGEPKRERPLDKGIIDVEAKDSRRLLDDLSWHGLSVTAENSRRNLYTVDCDAVVVGSGCGGGVAAATLAKAGHKVVVVEKGGYFWGDDYSSLEGPSLDQLYQKGAKLTTMDMKINIMAGSTVGGGSAINWAASIRTPDCAEKCLGVLVTACGSKSSNSPIKLFIRSKLSVSACGALMTPPLLISSGLKNPNIGKNLHLHPVLLAWGYFPESDSSIKGKVYEGGIITTIHKILAENNSPRVIVESPSMGPATYAALTPWVSNSDMKERMLRYSRTVHLFALVRDVGSGEVKVEERINYRLSDADKESLRDGLRRVLRILVAAGATEVGTTQSDGQRIKAKGIKKEDLEEFLNGVVAGEGVVSGSERWTMYSSAHQMGSCRMGVNEAAGAVDEHGQSREAEGLFVCDGSLVPTAIGVNPMITIQSVAYCVSNRMVEFLRCRKSIETA